MMKYRDIEYAVVQGIGRHSWKWSASVADVITGQAYSKLAAVIEAEQAIDRALALKKGATCATQGGNECALAVWYSPLNGKPLKA
jgi:hypothetical protein